MANTSIIKPFNLLTPFELYAVMRLRNAVFVVEQQCIYQEADNKDQHCEHLMLFINKELAGYARLVPPGISYPEMSIGRVVTSTAFRRKGIGKMLMQHCIDNCYRSFGTGDIKISAQAYIQNFYRTFGFQSEGAIYDEDGIPHIQMIKYYK